MQTFAFVYLDRDFFFFFFFNLINQLYACQERNLLMEHTPKTVVVEGERRRRRPAM